ncbi:bla regulator protein BlaR1 [Pedobacter sp. UYP24]
MEFQTAIYTTLLHSLWMGLVVTLLTGLIIVATKKSTAALRYNLLTATLCLFVISIAAVFFVQLSSQESIATTGLNQTTTVTANNAVSISPSDLSSDNTFFVTLKSMISFWSQYSNQIVLIWFLIICAKCVQLLAGLHTVSYLKKTSVIRAGSFWEDKVTELATKLSITKHIQILHSGLAKVPMIVGHFKPVILVPLGMLNGLSLKEVEAILSHELAHLKRNDYLVNLLQSLVEIIFFFNPGVLWLSNLIKEERENCCDDLALSCTENKQQYIKALISCQEFKANQPAYALAINGRKNSLKERVGRLVFNSNSSLSRVEKVLLTVVLVSSLVLTAAFSSINKGKTSANLIAKPNLEIPETSKRIAKQDSSKKTIAKKIVLNKSVKQKAKMANSDIKTPQKVIGTKNSDAVKAEIDAARSAAKAAHYDADAKKYEAENKKYEAAAQASQAKIKQYEADVKKYQANVAKYQTNAKRYAADINKYAVAAAKHAADPDKYPAPAEPTAPSVASVPATPRTPYMPPVPPTRMTLTVPPLPPIAKVTVGPINLSNLKVDIATPKPDMTTDLRNEVLLKDTKNFKYKLNGESLIIDGVEQPEHIHQKYLNKYLKNRNGTITTSVSSD